MNEKKRKIPVLSGEKIVQTFGETKVLNEIDIEIYDGDFTVIMGTSGSGKSTLLYCLSGMEQASGGTIYCGDQAVTGASEKELTRLRADKFGFVFQKTHLVSNLTLYENIVMAGLIGSGLGEKEVRERAGQLAAQMNLQDAADRLPAQVSGGEAQRAAVARAVMGNPAILFADEPTGALNKANTREVLNLFTTLHDEGQTILLVTHDKEAALRGNRILYIEDGRVISELRLPEYGRLTSDDASRKRGPRECSEDRKNYEGLKDRENYERSDDRRNCGHPDDRENCECSNDRRNCGYSDDRENCEHSDDNKNLHTNDTREKKLAAWLEGLGW